MKHSDYLKKKKIRETRKKIISVISAIVVFITTYALVLPAITLDVSKASQEPGIAYEQMQFKATAAAASVTAADSTVEEAQVEEPAAEEPEEEPAEEIKEEEPAETPEEEASAVSAEEEEEEEPEEEAPAEPEQEEAPAQEAPEVQEDKSEADSADEKSSEPAPKKAEDADTQKAAEDTAVDQSGTAVTDAAAAATTAETAAEFKIPELDALDFDDILTSETNFYYYHPENAEEAEDLSSDAIDDWKKVGSDTVLAPEDFVRVYLSYEIPAGALNETNTVARYKLPAGLELSDKQIKAINKYENGIAASVSGSDQDKYLGAEAIEGGRTPDEKADDEYISATVKVKKTDNDRQELVFTFIPYTVEKNRISYDDKGEVKSKGKEVKGFFCFDLKTAQIDFDNTNIETVEKEDGTTEAIQYSEAKVVFADKDSNWIERALTLAAPAEKDEAQTAEPKTLTSEGPDYTVTVSYTDEAQIPDNAALTVSEIGKDTSEYEAYLEQAKGAVDDETKSVNEARFFDITIMADGEKVEPQAPVSVQINFAGIEQTNTDDTQLLHYKDSEEVEVMDKAEFSKSEEQTVDTVQFETEGFSVYGIVGTETIEKEITLTTPDGEGVTYVVSVTYGPDANIPDGSTLSVSEIAEGTAAYDYARNSVLADKKEKGEFVDIDDFNLAALDISIMGPDGKEVEPEATVQVDIRIKELPGVEILDRVKNTIEVQHHVETGNGVVVDKVFEGKTDGSYTMDTNENVIATGTVVDPSSVSEDDFIVAEDVVTEEETEAEDSVTITFGTDSFSTYTITWGTGRGTDNSTATLRWSAGNQYINVTVHFVDENGTAITRPGNGTVTASPNPGNNTTTNYTVSQTLFGTITGWSFVGAYRDANRTQAITDILIGRGSNTLGYTRAIAFYNDSTQVGNTVGANSGAVNAGDIYVVYSNTGNHVTVHFVDRDGNELTGIKDPNGNVIDDTSVTLSTSGETIDFSDFTKDGYTYSNIRLHSTSTGNNDREMWSEYRYNNNNFQGTTDAKDEGDSAWGAQWFNRNFLDGDELYVIFDPVPTSSGGDGGGSTPIADLPDPETSKTLTDNHDGTYDLNLSITGKSDSKEENKNINVLFVIDSSSSMGDINSSTSRIGRVKTDVIDSARTLLSNNTATKTDLVEVAAVSFDNKGYDVSGWTTSLESFSADINDTTKLTTHTGTNWEAGLQQALSIGTGDGDPTYVIFFTDGMPQGYVLEGNTNNYQSANSHYLDMAAAKDEARKVITSGMKLYGIFAYGSDSDNNRDLLGRLVDYAYNDTTSRSTYYKTAANSDDVSEALAAIVDSITQAAGFDNVKLTDGITGMTQSTVVHGQAGAFTYYRSGGKNADDTEKYDSTANEGRGEIWTGAPTASYSASTGVTWDLSSIGQLEDGVTYTVSFTVWPDQDAYDTVAEINNTSDPRAAYEALDSTIKSQILFDESTGKCSLKTNTEAKAEYTTIKTSTQKKLPEGATQSGSTWTYTDSSGNVWTYVRNSDGTYTGTTTKDKSLTYDDVPAMSLEKTTMKVRKVWVDSLTDAEDRPVSVDFTIYEDGVAYQTVHLTGEGQTWEAEINIAPGIYVTPGTHDTASSGDAAGVMEGAEGHVYTIAETGYSYIDRDGNEVTVTGVENHYDFETTPVKPMLNGTTTSDETDMIEYLTKTTWSASEAALVATNTVKDGIYIYKKVTTDGTDEIDCEEQFTIKVTLKDSEGNPVYTTSQVSGDLAWRIDKEDASSSSGYTEESRGYYTSTDGTVTLTMDASGRIRIVNVPVGTTFTVEEVTAEGTMPMGYEYYSSQVNEEAVTTDNKASGTTVGNKQWATTITNKRNALFVDLLKVDNADTSKTLEGAEFSLFMADGTTPATDADGNAIGTIRSGADGKVSIGSLLGGNYVLKETKAPDGYNLMPSNVTISVTANNVTAIQGTSQCTVVKSDDGLTYTITVTNSAGVELPMTGGSGTLLYTLGGIVLIMASALMYGFRMRRRERRLN